MRWVPDSRFGVRPQYTGEELDAECERIVNGFLAAKYGEVSFPIPTDDLSIMLERETSDLDLYADLSSLGEDVEGVTEFSPSGKPLVRISEKLSHGAGLERRLRITLAHEYSHVRLHSFLWALQFDRTEPRFWSRVSKQHNRYQQLRARFERSRDLQSPALVMSRSVFVIDSGCPEEERAGIAAQGWMESQARYASMALLMPISALKQLTRNLPSISDSPANGALKTTEHAVAVLANAFDVTAGTVRSRLASLEAPQNSGHL